MKKVTESLLFLQKKHTKAKGRSTKQNDGKDSQYVKSRDFVLEQFCSISKVKQIPKVDKKNDSITAQIIDDFSLLTNPETTLQFISDLTTLGKEKKLKELIIDHSKMPKHDLSAEILLGQSVLSIRTRKRQNDNSLAIKGIYPLNQDLSPMIDSIGIVEQIKADKPFAIKKDTEKVKVFKAVCTQKEEVDLFASDKKTQATINFIDYMDECLKTVERRMTDEAGAELSAIIGELIGNAEDHADIEETHWQIYGYMDKNSKGEIYQQISIFNFGKSISQTFIDKLDVKEINERVTGYTNYHKKKLSLEELLTVMAFQENVSSKLDLDSTRGQGFTDLLLFFESITQECTNNGNKHIEMSVISGDIYTYFDGKYLPLKDEVSDRHLVYFNETNNFLQLPDKDYIRKMDKVFFPGTIVTLKYHLKESETESLEQPNDD
jgi:hypothetical protein